MKTKFLWIVVGLSLLLSGCSGRPHIIGYDIMKSSLLPPEMGKVTILPFNDARPEEEHRGTKPKPLSFTSKDAHFSKEISLAVEEILSRELNSAGFSIVQETAGPDYTISGTLEHFQAIISPAKITFLPYLGTLATIWAKDEFTIAISIYIKMINRWGKTLIDQRFDVSEDMQLPTGLLNLARYSRGFNYKLKLLDEALKDVMGQIREQVVAQAKK